MNIKTADKLRKARKTYSSTSHTVMAAYQASGYDEITEKYITVDGTIKLSSHAIGTILRRHKELAAISSIRLNIQHI